jgi:transcription initiation factor TFIIIB Brf1 subunit/transcription initiation factor TFIIB
MVLPEKLTSRSDNTLFDETTSTDSGHGANKVDETSWNKGLGTPDLDDSSVEKILGYKINKKNRWMLFKKETAENKIKQSFETIENICRKKHLSIQIHKHSCYIYQKLSKENFIHNKNDQVLAISCVYLICKELKSNITVKELSEITNINYKKVNQCLKEINKKHSETNLGINPNINSRITGIKLEVNKFPNIPEKNKRDAMKIMDKKNFETLLSGINIVSIAAGMIDIISRTNELEIKPQSIAKFYKISENTVRKNSKNIAAKYNIKLTDKRKKSMRKVSN